MPWWPRLQRTSRSSVAWRLGLIGAARIVLWQHLGWYDYGPHYRLVALTVSLALVGVVTFGPLTGSMLPFILRRLGFDPASASAPFVATLVDVTGLVIYFTVALLILRGTLLYHLAGDYVWRIPDLNAVSNVSGFGLSC
jgi:magnesium transporter